MMFTGNLSYFPSNLIQYFLIKGVNSLHFFKLHPLKFTNLFKK